MKKIYTILTGIALIAALASCDRKEEFKTVPFARLENTSYMVDENSGLLRVPVSVYDNDGGSGSVTFVVKDGSAVEGTNFTVEPANGVLSFTGNGTQYIDITIINLEGIFTGNLNLTACLSGVSGDLTLSPVTDCSITIKDLDHPLAALFGTYTSTGTDGYWGDDYTGHQITISAYEEDVTKVLVYNLDPYLGSYGYKGPAIGSVNDDKNVVTIAQGQWTTYTSSSGPVNYYGFDDPDPDVAGGYADIVLEFTDANTFKIPNAWGSRLETGGWYELLYGGAIYKK